MAPADFIQKIDAGNPPPGYFSIQSPSGSITVSFCYACQGDLTGNASAGEYVPVKNLGVVIQDRKYVPEEYYDTLLKYYVFKIESILNNGDDRQIGAGGRYVNVNDAEIVSKILSSFKFFGAQSFQYVCPLNGWINCMPILSEEGKKTCSQEAVSWYRINCSNFQGIAQ